MRVKFILPALTEASSPYWRPIKYSLFRPLGLATLAGYLDQQFPLLTLPPFFPPEQNTGWAVDVFIKVKSG